MVIDRFTRSQALIASATLLVLVIGLFFVITLTERILHKPGSLLFHVEAICKILPGIIVMLSPLITWGSGLLTLALLHTSHTWELALRLGGRRLSLLSPLLSIHVKTLLCFAILAFCAPFVSPDENTAQVILVSGTPETETLFFITTESLDPTSTRPPEKSARTVILTPGMTQTRLAVSQPNRLPQISFARPISEWGPLEKELIQTVALSLRGLVISTILFLLLFLSALTLYNPMHATRAFIAAGTLYPLSTLIPPSAFIVLGASGALFLYQLLRR